MNITIDEKNKDKVLEFANNAISLFNPNSTSLGASNMHPFNQYIYALLNLIKIGDTDFKSDADKRKLIEKAICKTNGSSLNCVDELETNMRSVKKEYSKKGKKTFYFVYPLKIEYNSIKNSYFTIHDTEIKIHNYKYIRDNFSLDTLIKQDNRYTDTDEKIKDSLKRSLSYFVIEEKAINVYDGKKSASDKIELLRSIINFHLYFGVIQLYGDETKSVSPVAPSKAFFAFNSNCDHIQTWTTFDTFNYKEIDFTKGTLGHSETIKSIEWTIQEINSIPNRKFKNLIIAAFRFHNDGLDYYYNPSLSFLCFWQMFELISRTSSHKDVCKRMLSFFEEKYPYADIIMVLKNRRNEFVHEGKSDVITANDVNMIINLAQRTILFLIRNAKQIKTIKRLELFYNNINNSSEDFKDMREMSLYIKKLKLSEIQQNDAHN